MVGGGRTPFRLVPFGSVLMPFGPVGFTLRVGGTVVELPL